jgi:hypothetical protein
MSAAKMISGEGRVIGVYREGDRPPHYLKDRRYVDFRDDRSYERSLRELVLDLNGIDIRPPLGQSPVEIATRKKILTKEEQEIGKIEEEYDSAVSEWYDLQYTHMDHNEIDNSERIRACDKLIDDLNRRFVELGVSPKKKPPF